MYCFYILFKHHFKRRDPPLVFSILGRREPACERGVRCGAAVGAAARAAQGRPDVAAWRAPVPRGVLAQGGRAARRHVRAYQDCHHTRIAPYQVLTGAQVRIT